MSTIWSTPAQLVSLQVGEQKHGFGSSPSDDINDARVQPPPQRLFMADVVAHLLRMPRQHVNNTFKNVLFASWNQVHIMILIHIATVPTNGVFRLVLLSFHYRHESGSENLSLPYYVSLVGREFMSLLSTIRDTANGSRLCIHNHLMMHHWVMIRIPTVLE